MRRAWSSLGDRLGSLLSEDVVYEMPQTQERIRGRAAFMRFNADYPGDGHLRMRQVVADGRFAALWLDVSQSGLVERITDYWPESNDPPAGREHLVERW
ncbi:hypothetical protein GCM10010168_17800 [Actinoplanes ianthinogenes]|uniref:SnoaL-like domain-containing protein n=1 Tax=Actinoplanes ianthinogenes TaxID=122358 RepID=A0ABN6CQH6_9ACTN|nr:nuclear transport factor 2 family protein [Actinoplanes ianthinogenes]BCJ47422.1 hypothetical protein Aiant_80790 [Actinoplanes ianthinogenes]GGR01691.1 hypothetical protein GCM10010168_17800 [Actinoplanes ianthinogenes]